MKEANSRLTSEERAALRAWLAEAASAEWDRKIEADVKAGRLDWLRQEAKEELRAGRCSDR